MKLFILFSVTIVLALASDRNQRIKSGWNRQVIRNNLNGNNHFNPSRFSSESDEQSKNILKTQIYNPDRCILVPEPTSDELHEFRLWTQKFRDNFSEYETSCRMINVINKLREIHAHNKRFDEGRETFRRALNHLSGLSRKELEDQILMKSMPNWDKPKDRFETLKDFPEPRPAVDYREENLVGPVGQQGGCSSCWAWSSSVVLEAQLRKCGISEESVSPQKILDCVNWYNGCLGGNPFDALSVEKTAGILTAAKYPYYAKQNRCAYNRSDIIGYVDEVYQYSFLDIPEVEPYMRKIVSSVGPVVTVVYADKNFDDYASGVFSSSDCNSQFPNHAITIVGYGTDPKFGDYWLFKNSWGTTWGENGYGRIARGKNMCHFESRVYFAQIMDKTKNVCSLS